MAKVLESRSVKIDITISEKREGSYSNEQVASHTISIGLPAEASAIGNAVANAVRMLAVEVDAFRGVLPVEPEAVVTE